MIDFTYPWLPTKCATCGKWGHMERVCSKQKEPEVSKQLDAKQDDVDKVEKLLSPENSLVMADNGEEQAHMVEFEHVDQTATDTVVATEEVNTVAVAENDGRNEEKWLTPTKISKSPEKVKVLELGQVSTLSNSRFAILSSEEEEEEEREIMQQENVGNAARLQQEDNSQEDEVPAKIFSPQEKDVITKAVGTTRPSLPRLSKENHKLVSTSTVQKSNDCDHSLMNKKSTRKNN